MGQFQLNLALLNRAERFARMKFTIRLLIVLDLVALYVTVEAKPEDGAKDVGLDHTAVVPDNKKMMVELGRGGSYAYNTGKDSPDKLMVRPKGSTQMRTSKRSSRTEYCESEVCKYWFFGIWHTKCGKGSNPNYGEWCRWGFLPWQWDYCDSSC